MRTPILAGCTFVICISSYILADYFVENKFLNKIFDDFGAIILSIITTQSIILFCILEKKYGFKYMKLLFFNRNDRVRLSISYLFRIKIDGVYLLVKNDRTHKFAPVGGVYKYFDTAKGFLESIGCEDDKHIPVDKVSKCDLRINIPRKNIYKFLKWFDANTDREIGGWREFYEELVKPNNMLPKNKFSYVNYRFIKRHYNAMEYSVYHQINEIRIADIFELIPSKIQEVEIKNLDNKLIVKCNEEKIRRRGAGNGQDCDPSAIKNGEITDTASWIL